MKRILLSFYRIFIPSRERDCRLYRFLTTYSRIINDFPPDLLDNIIKSAGIKFPLNNYILCSKYSNLILTFDLEDIIWFVKNKDNLILKKDSYLILENDMNSIISLYNLKKMESENNCLFEVVTWPEVQDLFEKPNFRENSVLINDEPLYSEFGNSSYLVRVSWLKENS